MDKFKINWQHTIMSWSSKILMAVRVKFSVGGIFCPGRTWRTGYCRGRTLERFLSVPPAVVLPIPSFRLRSQFTSIDISDFSGQHLHEHGRNGPPSHHTSNFFLSCVVSGVRVFLRWVRFSAQSCSGPPLSRTPSEYTYHILRSSASLILLTGYSKFESRRGWGRME